MIPPSQYYEIVFSYIGEELITKICTFGNDGKMFHERTFTKIGEGLRGFFFLEFCISDFSSFTICYFGK